MQVCKQQGVGVKLGVLDRGVDSLFVEETAAGALVSVLTYFSRGSQAHRSHSQE